MRERLGSRRGLTLIELLVTVTVLSIAVALVIPSVGQTGVLRVQSAVRTIASDIALAQTEAMAFQTRRALYFGAIPSDAAGTAFEGGNGYVMVEPSGTSLGVANLQNYTLYMPEDPGRPFARRFDEAKYGGSVITSPSFDGNPFLAFDELGGPLKSLTTGEPGSGGTVLVEAEGFGVSYELTVEAMTGRVNIDRVEVVAPPAPIPGPSGGAPQGMGAQIP